MKICSGGRDMGKNALFGVCLVLAVPGCAMPSGEGAAEEANVAETAQALEAGLYRYTAARYQVGDWTSWDPNGTLFIVYPQLYVPLVASLLSFQTIGGSGNLDLAVDFTSSEGFGCVSANAGTEERCRYADPPAGFWSSELQVWDPTEGVLFIQSYALPAAYEVEVFRGELERDAWQTFGPFPVASGSQLSVELEVQDGNPDLYLRWDADPDLDHWDCRPFEGRFASEVCDVPVPEGATAAHVSLHHNSSPRNFQTRYKMTVISAEVL